MSPLFGPDPKKVLARGEYLRGRVVGIKIGWTSDDSPSRLDHYAVEAGGRVFGIRQDLQPEDEVRLGMDVGLRVEKDAAVIEWGRGFNEYRWKRLKEPPAPGIEDDSDGLGKARSKWVAATATIVRIERRSMMMGLAQATDAVAVIHVEGQEDYELTISRVVPLFYASHLFAPGRALPAWVDPKRLDKVKLDWARAAMADPGVGEPPATPRGEGHEPEIQPPTLAPDGFAAKLLARAGVSVDGDPLTVEDPVGWDAFVAVQRAIAADGWTEDPARQEALAVAAGLPPGAWADARERWMGRIASDLGIGQAYRTAMGG
jgi:hypothetical protein